MPTPPRQPDAPAPEEGLPAWGKYCLDCHYPLHGLTTWRCPECGRPFDPEKPETFAREPAPAPAWRRALAPEGSLRLSRGMSAVALVLLVALGQALFFSPLGPCLIVPVFPFYVAGGTWLVMNLLRQEGGGGFVHWTIVGVVAGTLLGALQLPLLFAMAWGAGTGPIMTTTFLGTGIGLIVALVRTYFEM